MPRRFYKYKLLFDEGFLLRKRLPILNSRFDVKHINADFHQSGLKDDAVYQFRAERGRLIVTFNDKDFRSLAEQSKNTGVIGVSANLPPDTIDKKLTALLTKATENELRGKFTYIRGEM